ncbi:Putative RNA methylase family UPF0020, putative [Angomonas deanei]|uniref:RNA methylase family UPF0020, putative n=1 Tax=Angomonas deanei TaxID=59799 RepID=A0A7G2C7G0_9TRYP|nr:Putative RNA methylase family UPF0020, putative [Angomonas deanei]
MSGCDRTYWLVFPSGIEDVVRHTVEKDVVRSAEGGEPVQFLSNIAEKRVFVRKAVRRPKEKNEKRPKMEGEEPVASKDVPARKTIERKTYASAEEAMQHLRGALFFHFQDSVSFESEVALLDRIIHQHRCVEKVCLHLFSSPCKEAVGEIDEPFATHKSAIRQIVMSQLHSLQQALYQLHDEAYAVRHRIDEGVSFRVTAVRKDKSIPCSFKSTDVAAHLGELIAEDELFADWQVNMLYYNVEVYVVHDEHFVHVGVSLSPLPLPRCGRELDLTSQLAMEFERDFIGHQLQAGALHPSTSPHLKALIPRGSSHRNEVRLNKGENSMHPALAAALVAYADLTDATTMLDPFAGSGTVLVETLMATLFSKSLVLLGSDLSSGDTLMIRDNTDAERILYYSLVQEMFTSTSESYAPALLPVVERIRKWKALIHAKTIAVDVQDLTPENLVQRLSEGLGEEVQQEQKACEAMLKKVCRQIPLASSLALSMRCDAVKLPWKHNTIDRIISDLPFGRRCGNHKENASLYPLILKECYRLLTPPSGPSEGESGDRWWERGKGQTGGRAVLLTIEGELMMNSLELVKEECPFHLVTTPFTLDMGGLFPYVFVLEKR